MEKNEKRYAKLIRQIRPVLVHRGEVFPLKSSTRCWTKRWTALKPKNCTVCGIEYVPRSAISKYCPECRKRIRKVQGTETKRRSRERKRQACIELSAKNDRLIWSRWMRRARRCSLIPYRLKNVQNADQILGGG